MLIIIIMAAILITQRYILRGFAGRWKAVGDTFGQGKQYDLNKTAECAWSQKENTWYGAGCFDLYWEANYSPCLARCLSTGGRVSCDGDRWDCGADAPDCCTGECTDHCTSAAVIACPLEKNIPCNS